MDNAAEPIGNDRDETTQECTSTVVAWESRKGGPCVGKPYTCLTGGYAITTEQNHGDKTQQTDEAAQAVPDDYGTFVVLVLIFDRPAEKPFHLHVTYTVDGKEPLHDAPFVKSGNSVDPNSYRKIPVVEGAMAGLTAFRIRRDLLPERLLITIKDGDKDHDTVLLEQTLSALEEREEHGKPHYGRVPTVETRYETTSEAIVIDQKIIIPR